LHRAGIFRSSVLVVFVNYAGVPLLVAYVFSMFVFPWIDGQRSWEHVQAVWDRWQTLNTGALAFVASLVAFNISRFNENLQREREFVAAKAFLPSALSGLMEYCSQSANIYTRLWNSNGGTTEALEHPNLPQDYREVFGNCIRHADPAVGSYLSTILVRLQVHEARLRDIVAESALSNERLVDRYSLVSYLYRLGELYALLGELFGFARGEQLFRAKVLNWEAFRNAYSILGIDVEEIVINERMNLQEFTTRALKHAEGAASTGAA
jgi:hypothetical protein